MRADTPTVPAFPPFSPSKPFPSFVRPGWPTARTGKASASYLAAAMAVGGNGQGASSGAQGDILQSADFSHISQNQMYAAANKLYAAGAIDITQVGMLQLSGPLGKAGPNGEFIAFSAAERELVRNTPRNYLGIAKDAMIGIETRGEASNPQSGYAEWKHILGVLQERQRARAALRLRD